MLTDQERQEIRMRLKEVRDLGLPWQKKRRQIGDQYYNVIVCEQGDCPMGALIRATPRALQMLHVVYGYTRQPESPIQPLPAACRTVLGWNLRDVVDMIAAAADGAPRNTHRPVEDVVEVRAIIEEILQPVDSEGVS